MAAGHAGTLHMLHFGGEIPQLETGFTMCMRVCACACGCCKMLRKMCSKDQSRASRIRARFWLASSFSRPVSPAALRYVGLRRVRTCVFAFRIPIWVRHSAAAVAGQAFVQFAPGQIRHHADGPQRPRRTCTTHTFN